ncbi:nucleoporin NUP35 [Anabrus simplex]|uniref:nucleoporin NUP35 n=1 Tax=Anabrus simplex TaxID=316456 RepID=UPI0034DCF300
MEPMTLGSPVANPPSPGGTAASSPFLPAYLMGESAGASKPSSPTKPFKHVTFGTPPTLSPPPEMKGQRNIHLGLASPPEKSSGPPTKGLFDSLDETFSSPQLNGSIDPAFQEMTDCLMNIPTPSRRDQSRFSIANRTQLSFDNKQSSDDTWVTVFGFPPSSTSFIVSQFTRYGTIIDKRIPSKGNWIHLRFKTPMEARTALKSNGRVYPGAIMVGVIPCRDEEVLKLSSRSKENRALNDLDSSLFNDSSQICKVATPSTPVPHNSTFGTPTQADSPNLYLGTPVRISSIRPLNQAYRTAQALNEVQGETGTPQRSSSMVTKAMEYVFGW